MTTIDETCVTTGTVSELPCVTTTREDWITLSDGCRQFARTVLPVDAAEHPVPAVLEYLPYRLTDGTAHRDATQHPYFAGHGYGSVRVDMRGTGNSDGVLRDEYLPQEQEDGCEVIRWLADQPWCTGRVGIYGKSWGGFNGLQIAARRPPQLGAVISAYFTDDRYADDVHYIGGAVLAHDALSWASHMRGLNALPPDPAVVGDGWREMWLDRLRETPFFLPEWLRHQRRDDYWRQGSVGEDYGALTAPTLLVGGWADGYTNAVARTLKGLCDAGTPCRALVGPWSHGWPHVSEPGPRIGFLHECVRWWDHWLKGHDNGAMNGPLLRVWMQEYDRPSARRLRRSGRWVAEDAWPPPGLIQHALVAGGDGALHAESAPQRGGSGTGAPEPAGRGGKPEPARHVHVTSERSGTDAGAWCPYGEPTDFPPDQRPEDGLALSYTTAPLDERLEVLGVPEATLELVVDRPLALVAVRLCDVAPDGRSLLVARGLLNLTHRSSHAHLAPMPVGEPTVVRVPLDFTGHAFAPGHRIRMAVSSGYWPIAWPSPETVRLELVLGGVTQLALPVRAPAPGDADLPAFGPPEQAPPAAGFVRHEPWRTVHRDVRDGAVTVEVGVDQHSRLDESGIEFGERAAGRFHLRPDAPLSARVDCEGEHFIKRGEWRVRVTLRTSMSATADQFLITDELDAYEGDVRVHGARHSVRIPRDGG